jgi:hypothetical protein
MRLLVLTLILANGLYFAWAHGLMRAYGFGPTPQSEPQRLAGQINPEALRLLSIDDLKQIEAKVQADQAPKECLQAGPFDEAQTAVLRRALEAALPAAAWQLEAVRIPARWIIYMGKYTEPGALEKKQAQLAAMNIKSELLDNPALEPGFSLGGFDTQEKANEEMARLSQRGVRTARVVVEQSEGQGTRLNLPGLTAAVKPQLANIKAALAGKALKVCADSGH